MRGSDPDFLGRGWRFPPSFEVDVDSAGAAIGPGRAAMIQGDDDIRQSIEILMQTFHGERILSPDYGIGIAAHVFDPTDETQLGDLRSQIEHAILFFEPRIKVRAIELSTDASEDGLLHVSIDYDVPAINSRSNMVYPLYFKEGTNVRDR